MVLIRSSGDMDKGKSEHLVPKMSARKGVFMMIVNHRNYESNAEFLLQNKKPVPERKVLQKQKKYDISQVMSILNGFRIRINNVRLTRLCIEKNTQK